MTANLQELRSKQYDLRIELLERYKKTQKSLLCLSKEIGIPYTTFRGFMMGHNLGYLNIMKIKEWME
ncbi:MAG: hypothetical protein P4L31_01285 [Candidatus Babeliales bacterium]|nr:hypothetical protein [Candidatus Babeliales bacterium]